MKSLLASVIETHGGIERWDTFDKVTATIITDGALWAMKGITQDQDPRRMTAWLHEERLSLTPYGDPDWRSNFTPGRVEILTSDNAIVAERDAPRDAFAGHGELSPWDPLHRAYFNGYALWTYFTTPFLLTLPDVQVIELDPRNVGGETCRVLRAHFPAAIATHCPVQDFFFGEDLLLRRHDYSVTVAGGFDAAQLMFDYIEADGIRLPSRRRAYKRGPDGEPNLEPPLVSIDISDVRFI
jgi:hypothetical protein